MFDIGWTELLLIGVVALIVIGPKDLPDMFRQLGRFTAKLRSMSRDFQRAMEQAANESGVKDVAKDLKGMTSAKGLGLDAVKDAASKFEKWDPLKTTTRPAAQPLKPAPMPGPTPPVATAAPAAVPEPVAPTIHGPATQAQIDKKAARDAILKDTAARLKAVDADVALPAPPPAPKAKAKAKAKADPAAPAKPRAPRKTAKKADDA